ncbi:MAG: RidA family protein [Coriobacteriia bacterium]|nr:RidA family protein [Coriobacteriia bacterium]
MRERNPIPQGKYVPAKRCGNLIFTAGMTPRNNGVLIMEGPVRVDQDVSAYADAVRQAVKNALVAASNTLGENESIQSVLTLTVYVNAQEGFIAHSKLADIASEYLCEQLGEAGVAARAAVGVATLPGNAPCEIQLVACC